MHHEHAVELEPYLERQRRAGRAAVRVVERHPELFDVVGVGDVADVALREQFYTALLRYAFVVGVEEGLAEQVEDGRLTGAELRGRFERWVAGWAVRQASELRAWRERAAALERGGRRARRAAGRTSFRPRTTEIAAPRSPARPFQPSASGARPQRPEAPARPHRAQYRPGGVT